MPVAPTVLSVAISILVASTRIFRPLKSPSVFIGFREATAVAPRRPGVVADDPGMRGEREELVAHGRMVERAVLVHLRFEEGGCVGRLEGLVQPDEEAGRAR